MSRIRTCVAIAAVAFSLDAAQAIELLDPVAVPDGGLGSKARGSLTIPALGSIFVFGQENDAARLAQPTVWQINDQTPADWNEITLALFPSTEQGSVIGGRVFKNGDAVAVGINALASPSADAGFRQSVLWRKPAGQPWGPPTLLSPGASGSDVALLDGKGGEVAIEDNAYVAGTELMDGVQRPVLYRIGSAAVDRVELPTPPVAPGAKWLGSNDALGAALSILAMPASADFVVVGWTRRSDGLRQPCLWRQQSGAYVHVPLALPKGAFGQINAISARTDGLLGDWLGGEMVTTKGVTQGFAMDFIGGTDDGSSIRRREPLSPLPGFAYSSAQGYIGGSDDGQSIRRKQPASIGVSFNADGDAVPTIWIRSPKGKWEPLPARQILSSDEFFAFRSLQRSGDGFVGQIVPAPDTAPQGVALRWSRTHAPDAVQVVAGKPAGRRALAELTRLWHKDGRSFVVMPTRKGNERYANIEVSYAVSPLAGAVAIDYRIEAAATAGASGTLDVKVWSPSTKSLRTVGTHSVGHVGETITGAFSGDLSEFVDSSDARLRVTLEFRSTSGSKVGLALDQVTVGGFDGNH